MLTKNPEDTKLEVNIENFDDSATHANEDDKMDAKSFADEILRKLQ